MMMYYKLLSRISRGVRFYVWRALFAHEFSRFGRNARLHKPRRLGSLSRLSIDDDVCIRDNAWIEAANDFSNSFIKIGARTYIGDDAHIYAVDFLEIGEDVLIANRVYLSDNVHDYRDIKLPIIQQPVLYRGKVKIGNGAWIGENVCIIGASVGKHSIIAANSVVLSNVPDYCVVAGIPAKIIKRYEHELNSWVSVS